MRINTLFSQKNVVFIQKVLFLCVKNILSAKQSFCLLFFKKLHFQLTRALNKIEELAGLSLLYFGLFGKLFSILAYLSPNRCRIFRRFLPTFFRRDAYLFENRYRPIRKKDVPFFLTVRILLTKTPKTYKKTESLFKNPNQNQTDRRLPPTDRKSVV